MAYFQAVQAVLAKRAPGDARPDEDIEHVVRQIISRAVAPEEVIDIFAAAGLAKDMREAHARGDELQLSEDEQEKATETVLEHAVLLSEEWATT